MLLELVEAEFRFYGNEVARRRLPRVSCYFAKFVDGFAEFRTAVQKVRTLDEFRRDLGFVARHGGLWREDARWRAQGSRLAARTPERNRCSNLAQPRVPVSNQESSPANQMNYLYDLV